MSHMSLHLTLYRAAPCQCFVWKGCLELIVSRPAQSALEVYTAMALVICVAHTQPSDTTLAR